MATTTLEALRIFRAVADARSFTKAAAQLRLDKSQVSRAVGGLERSLDAALLVRTTRTVRLTADGERLWARIGPLLAGLEAAVAGLADGRAAPSGEVAIATTPDLGRELLAPALVTFRARFPLVRVRVLVSEAMVDLVRDRCDLALRVGKPGGDSLIARKLCDLTAGFFASPAYLSRRGTPASLAELAHHDGLWPRPALGQRAFRSGGEAPPAAVECADFGLLASLARLGAGVALLPHFLGQRDVAAGALVRVLPQVSFANAPLYLVSLPLKPLPPRVAALRAHLLETRWSA